AGLRNPHAWRASGLASRFRLPDLSLLRLSSLPADDEVGDPLRLVDLDVVPGAVEQAQLAAGEQRGEGAGGARVEGAVAGAEGHLARGGEAAQLRDPPPVAVRRGEQVIIQRPERRAGGQRLLVQLRDELVADGGVGDEPADLPAEEAPVQAGPAP